MTKARKQITIDATLAERVDDLDDFNLSGFVNDSLRHYLEADESGEIGALQAQIDRVTEEIEESKEEISEKQELRDELKERLEQQRVERQEKIKELEESTHNLPLDPTNLGVQTQADNLDLEPEELVEELADLRGVDPEEAQSRRDRGRRHGSGKVIR